MPFKFHAMQNHKIKVAVIGATGYTGAELIRVLAFHSGVELTQLISRSKAGQSLLEVMPELSNRLDLDFSSTINAGADIWFLALPHGASKTFIEAHKALADQVKIIDLSNEFRHINHSKWGGYHFTFGLPELRRQEIQNANHIANPGCFATAIILGLAPLIHHDKIDEQTSIHINATTGSTGAGASLSETSHFSYRLNNLSWYKAFTHQHLAEIGEQLTQKAEATPKLFFLPQRGAFARGIFATSYCEFEGSLEEAYDLYEAFYKDAAFTQVVKAPISLKQVVGTNNCQIHLHKHNDTLLITSAIDNLLKGAAGQAVQNMNLMFGFDESEGLLFKSIGY